jgi:hypothetical protein
MTSEAFLKGWSEVINDLANLPRSPLESRHRPREYSSRLARESPPTSRVFLEARSRVATDLEIFLKARSEATNDLGVFLKARSEATNDLGVFLKVRSEATNDLGVFLKGWSEDVDALQGIPRGSLRGRRRPPGYSSRFAPRTPMTSAR